MKVSLRSERHQFCPCELRQDIQVGRLVDQWNQCEVPDRAMKKRYLSRWFEEAVAKASEQPPLGSEFPPCCQG